MMKQAHLLCRIHRRVILLCLLLAACPVTAQRNTYYLKDGRVADNLKSVTRTRKGYILGYADNHSEFVTIQAIDSIVTHRYSETETDGLEDLLVARNGMQYRGQVVCQVPGKSFTLVPSDGGERVTIAAGDLMKTKRLKRNPSLDYWEQRPYDNLVVTGNTRYRGIIIEQNVGADRLTTDDDYIILFTDHQRQPELIFMRDVITLTTIYNETNQNNNTNLKY